MSKAQPKLLHVLGASAWRVPTVRAAKAMGYRVLVTDKYADQPAFEFADHHEVVDIVDFEQTEQVSRQYGAAGILCDTTDVGVATAAHVAECMGLPGIGMTAAMACTDKARMRAAMAAAGLDHVRFRVTDDAERGRQAAREIGYPLVVKPADNQSGRGVTIVHGETDVAAAWRFARDYSRRGIVLIESFVQGQEYIVDAFARDGQWMLLGIAAKTQFPENLTLSARIRYLDHAEFDAMACRIGPVVAATTAALGLKDGLLHAEFIDTGALMVPIDVAARGGGVMIYQKVLPHVSGIDAMAAAIRFALGEGSPIAAPAFRRAACVEFFCLPTGELTAIDGIEAAEAVPGVAAVHFNVRAGQAIVAPSNKDERPGFVVALADKGEQAVAAAERAKSLLRVRMKGAAGAVPVM